jgi:hypothetical protein
VAGTGAVAGPDQTIGDFSALAGQERLPGSRPLLRQGALVASENVAKLIAILPTFSRTGPTFSRTGHNQADVNSGGKVYVPVLTHTGPYQLDGTFADWQSRIKSLSHTLLRLL